MKRAFLHFLLFGLCLITSYTTANGSITTSGPLSGMTYGNGQVFSQTLNARLQPLNVQSSINGNVAMDMTYTYNNRDKVSNVINAAITGDNRTYGYDALGRLTSSTGEWGAGSYAYDALGNIQSYSEGSRALAMTYGPNNKLTSHTDTVGGARSLTYDARGNVTTLGALGFTYDMSDQPTSISGSASGTYTYDGNLKRVKSVVDGTTIYNVYDASGMLIHVDNVTSGESTDYLAKVARITKKDGVDTVTYLHADQLGSANTGTDKDGNVLWREQYTPFGRTLNSPPVNNDQAGFTGHIKDSATGLNYMQARYYDPVIGRFLSTDPIGFSPQRPEMFGRYTYVGNDPLNATDPTGMVVELTGSDADRKEFLNVASKATGIPLTESKGVIVAGDTKGAKLGVAGNTMRAAINSSDTIKVDAVSNDSSVFMDSFSSNEVDVADLAGAQNNDADFGAAVLTHIIAEKSFEAANGTGFNTAHAAADKVEASIFGATSIDKSPNSSGGFTVTYKDSSGKAVKTINLKIGANGTPK